MDFFKIDLENSVTKWKCGWDHKIHSDSADKLLSIKYYCYHSYQNVRKCPEAPRARIMKYSNRVQFASIFAICRTVLFSTERFKTASVCQTMVILENMYRFLPEAPSIGYVCELTYWNCLAQSARWYHYTALYGMSKTPIRVQRVWGRTCRSRRVTTPSVPLKEGNHGAF
jgi:hypothetical protein